MATNDATQRAQANRGVARFCLDQTFDCENEQLLVLTAIAEAVLAVEARLESMASAPVGRRKP